MRPVSRSEIYTLFAIILTIIYAFLILYLKRAYHCQGMNECKVWGSYPTVIITAFTSFWFFAMLLLVIGKVYTKKVINIVLLCTLGVILILGTTFSFFTYLKTTSTYIETYDWTMLNKSSSLRIPYTDIQGVGITSFGEKRLGSRYGSCIGFPYLVKNQTFLVLNAGAGDYALVDYLMSKNIKKGPYYSDECYDYGENKP